jgi:hypothetical protein
VAHLAPMLQDCSKLVVRNVADVHLKEAVAKRL